MVRCLGRTSGALFQAISNIAHFLRSQDKLLNNNKENVLSFKVNYSESEAVFTSIVN